MTPQFRLSHHRELASAPAGSRANYCAVSSCVVRRPRVEASALSIDKDVELVQVNVSEAKYDKSARPIPQPLSKDAKEKKILRMQESVKCLLKGLGEDIEREGLRDTPKRVAKALLDTTYGYRKHPASVLGTAFFHEDIVKKGDSGVVLVRDIDFSSTSETSFLPFHGRCHVAYVPTNGVVLGLSKFARLTKQCAKKLTTQERLCSEVTQHLQHHLSAAGVVVVIQARHISYDVEQPQLSPPEQQTTACVVGCFDGQDSEDLQEILTLLNITDLPEANIERLSQPSSSSSSISPVSPTSNGTTSRGTAVNGDYGLEWSSLESPVTSSPQAGLQNGSNSGPLSLQGPLGTQPLTGRSSSKEDGLGAGKAFVPSTRVLKSMESAIEELLLEIGEDPERQGLENTSARYVSSLLTSTSGYHRQLPAPLGEDDQTGSSGDKGNKGAAIDQNNNMFMHRSYFSSQCEHHMLPFYGDILVAYVKDGAWEAYPKSRMDGLVSMFTQRLQVQERITHQVADAALAVTGADGVMVVVCATHMCMVARGVENHAGATTSLATRGVFKTNGKLRNQVLVEFANGENRHSL